MSTNVSATTIFAKIASPEAAGGDDERVAVTDLRENLHEAESFANGGKRRQCYFPSTAGEAGAPVAGAAGAVLAAFRSSISF